MRMNRRNVLVGLGTIVAGGGAVLGTGAFDTVTAERNADFTVTNDGSSLVGLSGDGSYVSESDTGSAGESTIEFTFSKLNDDAESIFRDVLSITNQTDDETAKDLYIQDDGTVTPGGVIDFVISANSSLGTEGNSLVGSGNAITASPSETIVLDIVIDTTQGDPSTVGTITVVGEDNN